jgi:hypothetical protein
LRRPRGTEKQDLPGNDKSGWNECEDEALIGDDDWGSLIGYGKKRAKRKGATEEQPPPPRSPESEAIADPIDPVGHEDDGSDDEGQGSKSGQRLEGNEDEDQNSVVQAEDQTLPASMLDIPANKDGSYNSTLQEPDRVLANVTDSIAIDTATTRGDGHIVKEAEATDHVPAGDPFAGLSKSQKRKLEQKMRVEAAQRELETPVNEHVNQDQRSLYTLPERSRAKTSASAKTYVPVDCRHTFKIHKSEEDFRVWSCNFCHSGPHSFIYECSECRARSCRPCVSKLPATLESPLDESPVHRGSYNLSIFGDSEFAGSKTIDVSGDQIEDHSLDGSQAQSLRQRQMPSEPYEERGTSPIGNDQPADIVIVPKQVRSPRSHGGRRGRFWWQCCRCGYLSIPWSDLHCPVDICRHKRDVDCDVTPVC